MARIRNSGMKIRVAVFARLLRAQHAFPFEARILEINEKGQDPIPVLSC